MMHVRTVCPASSPSVMSSARDIAARTSDSDTPATGGLSRRSSGGTIGGGAGSTTGAIAVISDVVTWAGRTQSERLLSESLFLRPSLPQMTLQPTMRFRRIALPACIEGLRRHGELKHELTCPDQLWCAPLSERDDSLSPKARATLRRGEGALARARPRHHLHRSICLLHARCTLPLAWQQSARAGSRARRRLASEWSQEIHSSAMR